MNRGALRSEPEAVHLGLGTNMGDRLYQLRRALLALASVPEIQVRTISQVYETEYVGDGEQEPYYNACVGIETSLAPGDLLVELKGIEEREGRQPAGHMKPRPIDLDILLYGDKILHGPTLHVPHNGMRDRAFVLEPLAEIASTVKFPDSGETIGEACAKIRRKSTCWVRPLADVGLLPEESGKAENWDLNKEDWRAALAVYCR